MTVVSLGSYAADMRTVAQAARRNTHLIVARHKVTGEVQSWHARPRAEAVAYRDGLRGVFSNEWAVKAVPVRRGWWR